MVWIWVGIGLGLKADASELLVQPGDWLPIWQNIYYTLSCCHKVSESQVGILEKMFALVGAGRRAGHRVQSVQEAQHPAIFGASLCFSSLTKAL